MFDETRKVVASPGGRPLTADESQLIDALMSGPPKSRLSIIVIGDDTVSEITPAPMARQNSVRPAVKVD